MAADCSLNCKKNTSSAHVVYKNYTKKYTTCAELAFFCNSMNNLLPYNGLIDARMSASYKDLPVKNNIFYGNIQYWTNEKKYLKNCRAKRRNMERMTLACGGQAMNTFEDMDESCLGYAGAVYEHVLGENKFTFVEECKNPLSVTILLRAGNKHTLTQMKVCCQGI